MTRKTVTSLALAAGCAIALSIPAAQAQMRDTQVWTNAPRINAGDRAGSMAARNNAESRQYDRLLEMSPGFRQSRMRRECGPIADAQLRQNCFASFARYEPRSGYPSRGTRYLPAERMTGGSTGTMSTTTTTGTTGYGGDMYGAGYGASMGNHYYPATRPSGSPSGGSMGGAGR
jgi:hypothetical protein